MVFVLSARTVRNHVRPKTTTTPVARRGARHSVAPAERRRRRARLFSAITGNRDRARKTRPYRTGPPITAASPRPGPQRPIVISRFRACNRQRIRVVTVETGTFSRPYNNNIVTTRDACEWSSRRRERTATRKPKGLRKFSAYITLCRRTHGSVMQMTHARDSLENQVFPVYRGHYTHITTAFDVYVSGRVAVGNSRCPTEVCS